MADGASDDRIEALERQAAHAERTIEELNGVVLDQQRVIERLSRRLELMEDRLAGFEHSARGLLPEAPPPHY